MADNTVLPGTGETIASKDIGGTKHQAMVLADGVLGEARLAVVNVDGKQAISVDDLAAAFVKALGNVVDGLVVDPTTGRLRISVDNIAAALTLATVTTVGTVSTITAGTITTVGTVTKASQLGSLGIDASGVVFDMMDVNYAECVRRAIT